MPEDKSKLPTFECLGVHFHVTGAQGQADCPFCGKVDHFFANALTGQWDCKSCGETGNLVTFMTRISGQTSRETHIRDWRTLEKQRGLPIVAFKAVGMGWTGTEWWIPIKSEKGTVRDVRRWKDGSAVASTKGCHLQLAGLQELTKAPKGSRVWICEGEWDWIALKWLINTLGLADIVVAVPGASTFKDAWVDFFKGMRVVHCFDNDTPGDSGAEKAGILLDGTVREQSYLCWPESRPNGWDIRDHIKDGIKHDTPPIKILETLEVLIQDTHRRHAPPAGSVAAKAAGSDLRPANFNEVITVFKKWVHVSDEFEKALAISLATAAGNLLTGDPVWLYLVGPPGTGKTLILSSLRRSDRVIYKSSLTPACLVSGFNTHPDPSILPKLHNKTAIFKDGTELLEMHPLERKVIYSTLRGAFDGFVNRPFGNGIEREYTELHFNMLIGVTGAVNKDNQSSMGERFLKYEMRETEANIRRNVKSAVNAASIEMAMEEETQNVVARFLDQEITDKDLAPLPKNMDERITELSQCLALLRAQVDRGSEGDLLYRPAPEIATRIGKQLAKLGQTLTFVLDRDFDDTVFNFLERVVQDTSIGFHIDIIRAVAPNMNGGLSRDEIGRAVDLPGPMVGRRLDDLSVLKLVQKIPYEGKKPLVGIIPARWRLTEYFRSKWEKTNLKEVR